MLRSTLNPAQDDGIVTGVRYTIESKPSPLLTSSETLNSGSSSDAGLSRGEFFVSLVGFRPFNKDKDLTITHLVDSVTFLFPHEATIEDGRSHPENCMLVQNTRETPNFEFTGSQLLLEDWSAFMFSVAAPQAYEVPYDPTKPNSKASITCQPFEVRSKNPSASIFLPPWKSLLFRAANAIMTTKPGASFIYVLEKVRPLKGPGASTTRVHYLPVSLLPNDGYVADFRPEQAVYVAADSKGADISLEWTYVGARGGKELKAEITYDNLVPGSAVPQKQILLQRKLTDTELRAGHISISGLACPTSITMDVFLGEEPLPSAQLQCAVHVYNPSPRFAQVTAESLTVADLQTSGSVKGLAGQTITLDREGLSYVAVGDGLVLANIAVKPEFETAPPLGENQVGILKDSPRAVMSVTLTYPPGGDGTPSEPQTYYAAASLVRINQDPSNPDVSTVMMSLSSGSLTLPVPDGTTLTCDPGGFSGMSDWFDWSFLFVPLGPKGHVKEI
ncbi:MAG TPA: hypothetical protein VFF03_02300 [Rhodocyclaceae bacterium]|nr:hypothetical protein [Rhodocyclaceae bacterium]